MIPATSHSDTSLHRMSLLGRVTLTVLLGATCATLGLNPFHDHPTTSGINRGSNDELNSNTCYTISAEGLAMLTRNFYRSPPLRFDLGLIPTFNYYEFRRRKADSRPIGFTVSATQQPKRAPA